ncbi:MAG: flippase-like domain-containing protein [Thermoleophilia bacterium]|nr:flippase-like domain-containing protein [Thermoleophilia bacterium]
MDIRAAEHGVETAGGSHGWKKVVGGITFGVLSIAATVLVARHLTSASWPLQHADLSLVLVGAAAYLASFGFRALGWRLMFPRLGRPGRSRCLAACGAAAASGAVLPFRLDYLVKIGVLRRMRGSTLGIDTIVLSIVALGILDSVAMLPLAVSALATSGPVFRAPLVVVVLFCVGCLGVLIAGPRLVRLPLVHRSSRVTALCRRIAENTVLTRSTLVAGISLLACWTSRALGSALLLMALGGGFSPTLALVILCMAGATSILPITAGGAVAGMGATAGVLFALGASKDVAINFPLASGLLLTAAALIAALVGLACSLVGARGRLAVP